MGQFINNRRCKKIESRGCLFFRRRFHRSRVVSLFLQSLKNFISPLQKGFRQSRQSGHMDTVASVSTARNDAAEESDFLSSFLYRNSIVFYMTAFIGHNRQLVIMGGKEGKAMNFPVNVLHHRPGNAHTVIGTGAPADFVQKNEAVSGSMTKDMRYLLHFYHEGTLTCRNIISGSYPGENAVHRREGSAFRRNEGPCLCHNSQHRHLTHIGRFACHVGSSDNKDFLIMMVELRIVGHEHFSFQGMLYHGMAAILDGNPALPAICNPGPGIAVLQRRSGKTGNAVQGCQRPRRFLHIRNFRPDFCFHSLIDLKLQFFCLFLSRQRFGLKFL